eukprot:3073412-Rhodomonas_salina.1
MARSSRRALLIPLLWLWLALVAGNCPVAWISEFHYDNAGTDVGEFVEVVTTGDAASLSIVLYNGNDGAPYLTISSWTTENEVSGSTKILVADLPANGIQNGSPDGIALVSNGQVLEFISYEGTFMAVGGAADGMTSTDVGVEESSNSAETSA